jgi:hypothetical protein
VSGGWGEVKNGKRGSGIKRYRNNGRKECWNDGEISNKRLSFVFTHHSIIPILHHSILFMPRRREAFPLPAASLRGPGSNLKYLAAIRGALLP